MLSFVDFIQLDEVIYYAPKPVKSATQMHTTTHRSMQATIRGSHGAARNPKPSYMKQTNQITTLKSLSKFNKNQNSPARLQMGGKPVQHRNIGTSKPLTVTPNQTN